MKNIPKAHEHATSKAERLMIDLSWIKTESIAKKRYWLLIVMDEYTNFLWSVFLKHKDDQVQIVIKVIKRFQNETNVKVKYICFDNSGENHDRHPSIKCKFEYTAPDSPQQNGKIERKFATLNG
jgi:antitoxin component YwqK of YwqJK toxin-antitoxin module